MHPSSLPPISRSTQMATQPTTQTKYTNEQIRSAILRAASVIEQTPGSYSFCETSIHDCGTPMCMVGHIAAQLGMKRGNVYDEAERVVGVEHNEFVGYIMKHHIGFTCDPRIAAAGMRAYADKFFPASSAATEPALDSAYVAFRAAFTGAMEAA